MVSIKKILLSDKSITIDTLLSKEKVKISSLSQNQIPIIKNNLISSSFSVLFSFQAQAVTLTVAQAFKVALDLWEIAQEGKFPEQRGNDSGTYVYTQHFVDIKLSVHK